MIKNINKTAKLSSKVIAGYMPIVEPYNHGPFEEGSAKKVI